MPWTSALFLIGVLAISALPPMNGFVSEWLTLQTILRSAVLSSTPVKIIFAVCGALLALTAGLAVTCFAKVFAMGFLGMPRSEGAVGASEAHLRTRTPLALLALCCVLLGVLPTYVIPALDRAVSPLVHASSSTALVPPFFSAELQQRENLPAKFFRFQASNDYRPAPQQCRPDVAACEHLHGGASAGALCKFWFCDFRLACGRDHRWFCVFLRGIVSDCRQHARARAFHGDSRIRDAGSTTTAIGQTGAQEKDRGFTRISPMTGVWALAALWLGLALIASLLSIWFRIVKRLLGTS
jgi:hypothetical protein